MRTRSWPIEPYVSRDRRAERTDAPDHSGDRLPRQGPQVPFLAESAEDQIARQLFFLADEYDAAAYTMERDGGAR